MYLESNHTIIPWLLHLKNNDNELKSNNASELKRLLEFKREKYFKEQVVIINNKEVEADVWSAKINHYKMAKPLRPWKAVANGWKMVKHAFKFKVFSALPARGAIEQRLQWPRGSSASQPASYFNARQWSSLELHHRFSSYNRWEKNVFLIWISW